jgi:predicted flap endonuclease-1-like 5' DNA nuclease
MLYLLQTLSSWWLAALALGVFVGFCARGARGAPGGSGWPTLVAYLFLLGAMAAATRLLPGRPGLWLETALLAFAAYGIGCGFGWLVGSLFGRSARASPSGDIAAAATEVSSHASALAIDAPAEVAANVGAEDPPNLLAEPPVAPRPAPEPLASSLTASPPPAEDSPRRIQDADRLTQIEGVGEEKSRKLHSLGVRRLAEIAAWTPEQARWIGAEIGEPGVVERENWTGQAALLARQGEGRPGARPPATARPENVADEDNLRLIRGIDPTVSHELHEIGVWRFSQIGAWTSDHLEWIEQHLRPLSPASARFWPQQARLLASGALTDYARAVLKGEAPVFCDDMDTLAAWMDKLPRLVAPGAGDSLYAGTRPAGLPEPAYGESDDLTRIEGIDAALAARLNRLGIWDWRQIAHWRPENIRWIGAYLALPGTPERQGWIAQARALTHEAILSH